MVATSGKMTYSDGRDFCVGLGLDYAKWKTFDEWKNIMYITKRSASQHLIAVHTIWNPYCRVVSNLDVTEEPKLECMYICSM